MKLVDFTLTERFNTTALDVYTILTDGRRHSSMTSDFAQITDVEGSLFSFYDVTEKIAIVIGMFSFGYINELTGSQRNSVLALGIFFVIGFILLYRTSKFVKNAAV